MVPLIPCERVAGAVEFVAVWGGVMVVAVVEHIAVSGYAAHPTKMNKKETMPKRVVQRE
ncbi:hypothetical protein S7335_1115 [Synechococcus sp. PCC 7335]|nr:hypothetical protein S7335_1115 [Synechococcus sp. PCC 7335]